jgi:hypothetical protein
MSLEAAVLDPSVYDFGYTIFYQKLESEFP